MIDVNKKKDRFLNLDKTILDVEKRLVKVQYFLVM